MPAPAAGVDVVVAPVAAAKTSPRDGGLEAVALNPWTRAHWRAYTHSSSPSLTHHQSPSRAASHLAPLSFLLPTPLLRLLSDEGRQVCDMTTT